VLTASPLNPAVTQTLVENAGAATIKGFEGELELVPVEGLTLRSAVGYIDGKYDKFVSSAPTSATCATCATHRNGRSTSAARARSRSATTK